MVEVIEVIEVVEVIEVMGSGVPIQLLEISPLGQLLTAKPNHSVTFVSEHS